MPSLKFIHQDKGCLLLALMKALCRLVEAHSGERPGLMFMLFGQSTCFQPGLRKDKGSDLISKALPVLPLSISPQLYAPCHLPFPRHYMPSVPPCFDQATPATTKLLTGQLPRHWGLLALFQSEIILP